MILANNILLVSLILAFIVLIFVVIFFSQKTLIAISDHFHIKRHSHNPVLSPRYQSEWEATGTFNPAVITDDEGNIHMVYRALGQDGLSRIGYAYSKDGIHFDERLPYPIFIMDNPRKIEESKKKYNPTMYPSGGSWGGCEDPRLVRIDGHVYMTFNAFDGWDFIRIGITKIAENDFFKKRFLWKRPMLISPPGEINKNWVLFPEKINGKYAILHSITPTIQIDYVDRLEELEFGSRKIKSVFSQDKKRKGWDIYVRGAGPPPIKTDKGWLILYHAHEKGEMHKYKLGAMLLHIDNPTKIIARAPAPILHPDEWYENDWKPGVVYACGAVIKDNRLIVYYGGGDKYVCIGEANIHDLLDWMITNGKIDQ